MKMINGKTLLDKYNVFFVLMMLYVIIRAINIPIIYDEAITYRSFVTFPVWSIVTCENADANNHILNTLLTKIFVSLLGNSVLVLRITSILSFALYFFSVSRITRILFPETAAFLATISLCLHPGLTDYFALCRGYGCGIALMMFSVLQLLKATQQERYQRHIHLSLLSATLSVYCILSMLNFALGIYLVVILVLYRKKAGVRAVMLPAGYLVLLLALVAYPIYALNNNDAFYWGGDTNFVKDTMLTMLQEMMQVRNTTAVHSLILGFVSFFGLLAVWHIVRSYLKDGKETGLFVVPFLFIFCVACINFQFYLLSVKFIIFRTALYLYPLFILTLFIAVNALRPERARLAISAGVTTLISLNFCLLFNIKYAFEAVSNSFTREVLSDLRSYEPDNREIKLFSGLYEEPGLNYYISGGMSDHFRPVPYALLERSDLHKFEYLLLSGEEKYKAPSYYKLLRIYGNKELFLFKNTEK